MPITEDAKAAIRKYAIKNAMDYGKADAGSVMNKAISKFPDVKSDIKSLRAEVTAAVESVNALPRPELEKEYAPFRNEFEAEAEDKSKKTAKPKMVIEGAVEGEVFTRYPPEPGGYMHIGNAKQCILSDEFARIYKGGIFLYFDDTNPEKCRQEYVDAMKRDLDWLGIKFAKEYYASDYVEKVYGYAGQLLASGDFYVCSCTQEEMKRMRFDGVECVHRGNAPGANQQQFQAMLDGKYKEGEAVVRIRGDMKSQNTVMRDPVMLRIVEAPHFRHGTKYRVWPVYDFNTPIIDSINGVTDVIRSKEYELRDELSSRILGLLHLRPPRLHLEARLQIKGNVTAKRVLRKLISDGAVSGWDDPRLLTVMSLRRRGIMPQAIRNFVLRFGLSLTDSTSDMSALLSENKSIIDQIAKHMFFVHEPVKVTVDGAAKTHVKLRLHPTQDMGFREYDVGDIFYISEEDADAIAGEEVVRLKDLMDVLVVDKGDSEILAEKREGSGHDRIMQWASEGNHTTCSVLVPGDLLDSEGNPIPDSMKTAYGFVESYAQGLHEREIVQFERFGYCVLDSKDKMQFIFICK